MLGSYFEYKDFVIFEKFHDPEPAKKFKNLEIVRKNFFTWNNQESLNLHFEQHFG